MEHDELGFRVYTAKELKDFLIRHGYRECDIAACNCGSWHGGHASDRLRELRDVIGENGKTLLQSATDLVNKIADLQAKLSVAREALELFACENVSTVNKGRCCIAREALLQLEGQEGRGMTHDDTVCDNATDGKEATE